MKRDKKNRTAATPTPAERKADAIKQIADAHLEQAEGAAVRQGFKPCCTSRCL